MLFCPPPPPSTNLILYFQYSLGKDEMAVDVGPEGVSTPLHRLRGISPSSPEHLDTIDRILPHILEVDNKDTQYFIDVLDEASGSRSATQDPRRFRKLIRALRMICGLKGTLPSSYMLPVPEALAISGGRVASGGYADIWKGTYGNTLVAPKVLRSSRGDEDRVQKQFCKEVILWKRLSHMHPNIVPLLGVTSTKPPSMISEWMVHGNMLEYVCSHPDTDRLQLLNGICEGLEFLHSFGIVHGDLKGYSILIDSGGRARLVDFGLTFVTNSANSIIPSTLPPSPVGTYRYMSPELLVPEDPIAMPSTKSDIYALAMVIMEIIAAYLSGHSNSYLSSQLFTGQAAFHEVPRDPTVILLVMSGKRPQRPEEARALGLSDLIWDLVEMCWQHDSDRRPTMPFILDRVGRCP